MTIDSLDRSTRLVYNTPDPSAYTQIVIGEPASRRSAYTNYVQAVPASLFKPAAEQLRAKFSALVPAYPDSIYNFYKIDRFLSPGLTVPDASSWNLGIGELLRERGPSKQVNAIVVIAKTSDADYVYALRDAWEGANKNDVVLVIGSSEYPRIDFVDVITWSKNELFKIELRDAVQSLGEVNREQVLALLSKQIDSNFVRREMREFEYLDSEIDPPGWVLVILFIVLAACIPAQIYVINGKSWTPNRRFR